MRYLYKPLLLVMLIAVIIISGCNIDSTAARVIVKEENEFSDLLIDKQILKVEGLRANNKRNSYAKIYFTDGTSLYLFHDNNDWIMAKLEAGKDK